MVEMTTQDKLKFVLIILAAGTGWFVTPPQIDYVGIEFAGAYRMLLGGGAIALFAFYKKIPFPTLSFKNVMCFVISGMFLYSVNYLMIYKALTVLPSGICSLIMSAIIIPNALFGRLILKNPIKPQTIVGACISLVGLAILFPGNIFQLDLSTAKSIGFVVLIVGLLFSSFGTVMSSKFMKGGLNLYWTSALAMIMGGLINLCYGFYLHQEFFWSNSPIYLSLWIYISLFVTSVVFICYMQLVNKFGAANASYVWIISPMIALNISSFFEGMDWTPERVLGTLVILCGSLIALKRKKLAKTKPQLTS